MEYGVWDIETTSLDPKDGAIREIYTRIGNNIFHGWVCNSVTMIETCVPWTVPEGPAYPGQCAAESQLCHTWLLWLEQQPAANIWGYNSSKFDLPWLEEKVMQHQVIPRNLPGIKHRWCDLYVLMQQLIPRGQSRKLLDVWKVSSQHAQNRMHIKHLLTRKCCMTLYNIMEHMSEKWLMTRNEAGPSFGQAKKP